MGCAFQYQEAIYKPIGIWMPENLQKNQALLPDYRVSFPPTRYSIGQQNNKQVLAVNSTCLLLITVMYDGL